MPTAELTTRTVLTIKERPLRRTLGTPESGDQNTESLAAALSH